MVPGEVDRQPLKPLRNILKNPLDTARSRTLQLRTEGPSNSPGVFVNICTRLCLHATFNKPDPCALCPTFQAQSYSEKFPVIYNDFWLWICRQLLAPGNCVNKGHQICDTDIQLPRQKNETNGPKRVLKTESAASQNICNRVHWRRKIFNNRSSGATWAVIGPQNTWTRGTKVLKIILQTVNV